MCVRACVRACVRLVSSEQIDIFSPDSINHFFLTIPEPVLKCCLLHISCV